MDITQLKPGDIVEHKLNKDWLMVLDPINDIPHEIWCRTKSFNKVIFYDFELQPQSNK